MKRAVLHFVNYAYLLSFIIRYLCNQNVTTMQPVSLKFALVSNTTDVETEKKLK